jgi:hypothetical protein
MYVVSKRDSDAFSRNVFHTSTAFSLSFAIDQAIGPSRKDGDQIFGRNFFIVEALSLK